MGIDSCAIFDCRFSREQMLDLASALETKDSKFVRIFPSEQSQKRSWSVCYDDETEECTRISGGWPFELSIVDNGLLCLSSAARWKWLLQNESTTFLDSTRLVAEIVGAKRIIYLSDYVFDDIDTTAAFDQIRSDLGKPSDLQTQHEIVEGYWRIFFYEQLE